MAITQSTITLDQEKFLSAKLISRSYQKLVAASVCDKVQMPEGSGLTANFVRYKRMNVPLVPLTEGTDPSASSFSLDSQTVTLDQWGDIIEITDVAELTASHPLVQQCLELLADNAARVMDREIQLVMLAGTNVQYGDGSVTTRRTITTAMKLSDAVIHKARVGLVNDGVGGRDSQPADSKQVGASGTVQGGRHFLGLCGPEVMSDIMATGTSLGTFASVAMYSNQKALYNAEVGTWLGVRWVETNFIPRFKILGSTDVAVSSTADGGTGVTVTVGSGGSLGNATFFWKVTRKDLLRGFEEDISIAHSTASGGTSKKYTFAAAATAGYVYNVYFDTESGGGTGTDATLGLVSENLAASGSVAVTDVGDASDGTPPDNVNTTGTPTIHPVYLVGFEALSWVGFYGIKTRVTGDAPIIGNVLGLKKAIGFKFFGKAMIRDQDRLLRLEVAASY